MINKLATKKGSSGILNRTKDPKLATVKPTEKAKKIENKIEKSRREFLLIYLKNPKNLSLINRNMVKNSKYEFSKAEISMTAFLTSQSPGRKMPAKMACGAFKVTPPALASKSPIS